MEVNKPLMKYLHDLFGFRLNIFANVAGIIGAFYSATMLTIYAICFVREENLCSPLKVVCTFDPEEYRSSDKHFILELIYHAVWLVASVSLLLGNLIVSETSKFSNILYFHFLQKNDLLFLPWLYVVICDMILLAITLTYSIISFVHALYIIEGDAINRIILVQLHCMLLKIILCVVFLGKYWCFFEKPQFSPNLNSSSSSLYLERNFLFVYEAAVQRN